MKKIVIILLALVLLVSLTGCVEKIEETNEPVEKDETEAVEKDEPAEPAEPAESEKTDGTIELVVSQNFTDDSKGIVKAILTMTWSEGKMVSIQHEDTYVDEGHAQSMFEVLLQQLEVDSNLVIKGKVITYYNDVQPWSHVTFSEMVENFESDEQWEVHE